MALEKAKITPDAGDSIDVRFNPTQYSLDHGNTIAEIGVPGLSAPILQYVRGNTRTLSMELLFDTYEERADVRKKYTDKIYKLLEIERSTHAPPICTFTWKDFEFRCVLDRVGGRFTMFLEDGTPVRATLNVNLKEFIPVDMLVRGTPTESADHTKSYMVKLGDTLSSIAAAEYGDSAKWRPIASANRIDNPRVLRPGQVLVIPPLL
jgi:nucleoid-associated protein YgaU